MIFPRHAGDDDLEGADDPFLVPLAVPLIAGPGTIAILVLLCSSQPERILEWCIALILAWIGMTILLIASPFLLRVLGARGSMTLERLMGMVLVTIYSMSFSGPNR